MPSLVLSSELQSPLSVIIEPRYPEQEYDNIYFTNVR